MSSPLPFSHSATDPASVDPRPQEWPVSPSDERTGRDAIIWEKDPRTRRFTYVSKRAESLLGYPLRRWLGEPDFWLHILHPEDRERADALCRDATEHVHNHELEYRVVAADGRTHWLRDRVNVLGGPDGRAQLLQGVMVDITAQKAAEVGVMRAELHGRRAAERLRLVAAASADLAAAPSLDILRDVLAETCSSLFRHENFLLAIDGVRDGFEDDGDPASVLRAPILRGDQVIGSIRLSSRNTIPTDLSDQALLDVLAALASMALAALPNQRTAVASPRANDALPALLEEVTNAAIEARTFNEAAARCLVTLSAHGGWPSAHVFVRTDNGDAVSTGIFELNAASKYREITAVAARRRCAPGSGLVGRVLSTGEPIWIRDLASEPTLEGRAGHEVRGAFAFPVKAGKQVVAILEFTSSEPAEPDAALIDASRTIGAQLRRVLERENAQDQVLFQARLLDSVGQAVVASDVNHRVVYWNRAAEALFGWSRTEALGRTDSELLPARTTGEQTAQITTRLAAGQSWAGEFEIQRKDGGTIPIHITATAVLDRTGAPGGYVGVATDLRESKELDARLRHEQRLEAVGRLAGGVAHDFNNLLTSIKGVTLLLLEDLALDSPLRPDLEEIRRAADRAALLTSQLLAFGRRQTLQPRLLDLNRIVRDTLPVLRKLVGDPIELVTDLDPSIGLVHVDSAQIGQVIVNLAVNARDAMPAGGRITIRTANADVPARARADGVDLRSGPYVLLEIQDEGSGIAESEIEHIFEPFHGTSLTAEGSGLGLSTAYGIIKQSNGHVVADSAVGLGTTFRIYLPRARKEDEPDAEATPNVVSETILLVEDEDSVRRLARKILDREGYTVLEAANGVEALEACGRHAGTIDLVVSDVVMPHMNGAELIERLRIERPDVPVLLMSGYTGDMLARFGLTENNDRFLEKPFTPDDFARKVRSVLEAGAPSQPQRSGPEAARPDQRGAVARGATR